MKKTYCLLLAFVLLLVFASACTHKPKASMIKSERKFAKYIQTEGKTEVIDLSEGPRQRYEAYFGPKALDFDFKIVNPY